MRSPQPVGARIHAVGLAGRRCTAADGDRKDDYCVYGKPAAAPARRVQRRLATTGVSTCLTRNTRCRSMPVRRESGCSPRTASTPARPSSTTASAPTARSSRNSRRSWPPRATPPARRPVRTVSAGVSGLTGGDDHPGGAAIGHDGLGVRRVFLAHDSVTSYLGALGDQRGAVIAVGTGVVTLAVGKPSRWLGSTAGATWSAMLAAGTGSARAALDAVMRAHDGRGPSDGADGAVHQCVPGSRECVHRAASRPRPGGRRIAS